jgi:hypothetical protein
MGDTSADPFFDGLTSDQEDTAGGPLPVPVCLFDANVLGLVYRVDADVAAEVLAAKGGAAVAAQLSPLVTMGKALVQLFAIQARDANVGEFVEVALALHVRRLGTSPSKVRALLDSHGEEDQGYFVLGVAVHGDAMRAACTHLWGLPAYDAAVSADFRPVGIRAEISGELELMIGEPGRMKTPGLPITLLGGSEPLLRTTVQVDHRLEWGGGASASLRVVGAGPIADAVLGLGLEAVKPSYVWRSSSSRAILPKGEPLD